MLQPRPVLPGVSQRFRGCVPAIFKPIQRTQRATKPRPHIFDEALERRLVIAGSADHRRYARFGSAC